MAVIWTPTIKLLLFFSQNIPIIFCNFEAVFPVSQGYATQL